MKKPNIFRRWVEDIRGVSALEGILFLPILMTMLFGVFDVGRAITANHKMITASQVAADLVARNATINDAGISQAIEAAKLAMMPYKSSSATFGIDIVSVSFDSSNDPQVLWRTTQNMTVPPNAVSNSKGLGTKGEGAIIVTIQYTYIPAFNLFLSQFTMDETAYARGRQSPTVVKT